MKHKLVSFFLLVTSLLLPFFAEGKSWKATDLVDPYTIDSTQYVLDELGYLSDNEKASLNSFCARFNHDVNMELAIVLLDEIDDDSFEFGLELYNHWKLGRDSRGLLLTILVEQHVWQFNTGEGAEGVFPDGLLYQVGSRKLVPRFRKGDYAGGIHAALEELYQIALSENQDEYFESNGYDKSSFAGFSHSNSSSSNSSSYSTEESTWTDFSSGMYMVVLFFIGVVSSGMAHFSDKIKNYKDDFKTTIQNRDTASIHYKEKKAPNVSAWAGAGCLRYLLVDLGFFIVGVVSAIEEKSFLYFLFGFLLYITYWAVLWVIMTIYQIKKAGTDPFSRYFAYTLFNDTANMKGFKFFAPWIGYPISWWLSSRAKKYEKDVLRCPICNSSTSRLSISKESFTPTTPVEKIETEKKIFDHRLATCSRGHVIKIGLPGNSYNQYHVCDRCQERTATQTSTVTTLKPTYTHKGSKKIIYTCQNCQHESFVTEEIPMLTHSSSSSSGGGYHGGGYHGGSRGGGHSSGGGARGGW